MEKYGSDKVGRIYQETGWKELETGDVWPSKRGACSKSRRTVSYGTKMGSMVAYTGKSEFHTGGGSLEHGVGKMLKRGLTGKATRLTKAEGTGISFSPMQGKKCP